MQFLKAWFVNACVVFVFPALANDRFPAASDFTGRKAVLRLALSLAAAAGISAYLYRAVRPTLLSPDASVREDLVRAN